jgi:hypothetical protein
LSGTTAAHKPIDKGEASQDVADLVNVGSPDALSALTS